MLSVQSLFSCPFRHPNLFTLASREPRDLDPQLTAFPSWHSRGLISKLTRDSFKLGTLNLEIILLDVILCSALFVVLES
jgi:hypothetical protein